jgi:B-box zinc finger
MNSSYEKCPKHPNNDIILFCLGNNCIEPLCKECCKLHVHWHNSSGTRAEIDTVDTVRDNCLSDIHKLKVRFEEY